MLLGLQFMSLSILDSKTEPILAIFLKLFNPPRASVLVQINPWAFALMITLTTPLEK